jgi:imidazolonepropionase-like amidohydrolase
VLAFARMLHDAGVPMMIGTDGGGGIMIDREMELHREAGIPVWQVLRMATSATADIMKMGDRIGRIQEGYEADLAILEADPVADVRATAQVYAVINNGKLLRAEELTATGTGP